MQDNLLPFCFPGIYEIFCTQTKRSYFGQSQNVLYRLGRHFNDLEVGRHEVACLQNDWTRWGRDHFVFRVVEAGPTLQTLEIRLIAEKTAWEQCPHELYNTLIPLPSTFRKEWTLDGVTFSSGAQAARALGVSPSTVYRRMKRDGECQKVPNTKKISVQGQEFDSLKQAVSVLQIARSTLYRRLRSPNYPTWFYISEKRQGRTTIPRGSRVKADPKRQAPES